MKVVYFYPQFVHPAGTERILIDKANYLADLYGYDIILLTFQQGKHPFPYSLSVRVKHVDLDTPYDSMYKYNTLVRFFKWFQFNRVLQERFNSFIQIFCPDIVISTTGFARTCSAVVKCPESFVRIAESHIDFRYQKTHALTDHYSFFRRIRVNYDMHVIRKNIRRYNLLVALNQSDAEDWAKYVSTTVITNVVHLNHTGKIADLQSKHVIFVGRYVPQKGLFDLFKIWHLVHEKYPDWHLDLYGEGEQRIALEKEAERLCENIHIHHPDTQIFYRYLDSSILVMTSLFESFGLVMVEAMSCGLPVVAFNCPYGPAKIVTDGVNGFLVNNRDIQLFAERICQLIESEDLRSSMGHAAIVSSQCFSVMNVMPQWDALFNSYFKQ